MASLFQRPASEDWRLTRALLWKEFCLVANRGSFWLARWAFVAVLALALVVMWLVEQGLTTSLPKEELGRFSQLIAQTLCISCFVGGVIIGPAIAAGAIQNERETGMLEVLVSSPLTPRDLLVSVTGGRLLLALQFFVATIPLFAVPLHVGGIGPVEIVLRAIAPVLAGSTLSTVWAVSEAAQGKSSAAVLRSVVRFVLVTPSVLGIEWIVIATFCGGFFGPFAAAMSGSMEFGVAVSVVPFLPFCGLLLVVVYGPLDVPWITTVSFAMYAVLIVLLARRAPIRLSMWLRSQYSKQSSHESRSYAPTGQSRTQRRRILSAVTRSRRRRSAKKPDARERRRSLTRLLLSRRPSIERWIAWVTRDNPFVIRESIGGTRWFVRPLIPFLAIAVFYWLLFDRFMGSDTKAVAATIGLFLCLVVISATVTRLLPVKSQRGFLETLTSTPLSGWQVVVGAIGVSLVRTWPFIAFVALFHILPVGHHDGALWPIASVILFLAFLPLACSVALWTTAIARTHGERLALAMGTLIVLGLAPVLAFPADWAVARYHPLALWFDREVGTPATMVVLAAAVAGIAEVLLVAFALAYRRLLRTR